MNEPVVITSGCLSVAWARAFEHIVGPGTTESLLVQIPASEGEIVECQEIRLALDGNLVDRSLSSINTVANTIFPRSLWNPEKPRQDLYERYKSIWRHVRKCRANRNGVYFQRLIGFPKFGRDEFNQLEYIISTYEDHDNHRHSAHQASIYAPGIDSTNQRQRGFPCLQQVAFSIHGGQLTVIGFYPTQHMLEKAYGNYVGLCNLGMFMAHEIGVSFAGMQCFVSHPKVGAAKKTAVRPFAREIKALADQHEAGNA